jgi:hypothetical protein
MAAIKCFSDMGLTPAISLQPICAPDKSDKSQVVTQVEMKGALSAPRPLAGDGEAATKPSSVAVDFLAAARIWGGHLAVVQR